MPAATGEGERLMSSVAPTDAERLHAALVWAAQRYAIHFERCPARLNGRACLTCLDLENDEFDAADDYARAIRP